MAAGLTPCRNRWGHLCLCHCGGVQAKQLTSWSPRPEGNVTVRQGLERKADSAARSTRCDRLGCRHCSCELMAADGSVLSLTAGERQGSRREGEFFPGNLCVWQISRPAFACPGKFRRTRYTPGSAPELPSCLAGGGFGGQSCVSLLQV